MNQPQQATVDVANELIRMAAYGENNELAVKRLEREARRLLQGGNAGASKAWVAIGAACMIQGRHSECVTAFERAIASASDDQFVVVNVASLLVSCGELERALRIAQHAIDEAKDARAVVASIHTLAKALYFEEFLMAAQRFGLDVPPPLYDSTQALLAIADAHGLTPERRLSLVKAAADAVRKRGYAIKQSHLVQADEVLRYEFFIDLSAEQCGEVNAAIADALCEQFEDPAPEFVTFACRPMTSFRFDGAFETVTR